MQYVLVVHHDADLYGSDKSLLRTTRAMVRAGLTPIVALPHYGPLVDLLREAQIEVHIGPVGKLTRQLMRPLALPWVMRDMFAAIRFMRTIVGDRQISLAYSNSVAALGGALWGLLHRVPRLWHVREIVVQPKIAVRGFPWMLRILGGWCVCNSNATRDWITGICPSLAARSSVIWNGLEETTPPDPARVAQFRSEQDVGTAEVLVSLVGRINRWKGQSVLIEAAAILKTMNGAPARFLIVGDVADGQHHFRESMLEQIRREKLEATVHWHPFTPEVDVVWAASDIAVVPSVEPEPFGRVAIEAMAHGLPVVATAHGGLAEIVLHEQTGLLVPPGDARALAHALHDLINSTDTRKRYGAAGRARQQESFSQTEHDHKLLALMRNIGRSTEKP